MVKQRLSFLVRISRTPVVIGDVARIDTSPMVEVKSSTKSCYREPTYSFGEPTSMKCSEPIRASSKSCYREPIFSPYLS
jgi:hypothetical protein